MMQLKFAVFLQNIGWFFSQNIRHFIELRGIGIVNARRLFGMGAVKTTEKIDFIINLEVWDDKSEYDRMGIDKEYTEILDIKVPVMTIPVRQGRNLAVIIEVAAMNNREKQWVIMQRKILWNKWNGSNIMQPQKEDRFGNLVLYIMEETMSQLEKLEQLAISLHCDVRNQEPMRKHTTFKIGGPADLFIIVNDVQALQSVYTAAKELGVPCMVVGKGSNLLVKIAVSEAL